MTPLTEKYRPATLSGFAGLHKQRVVLSKLAAAPWPSAWLLVGESGTGKTTMALALAREMGAEVHHIPSRKCDLETVQQVCDSCHYMPWGGGFHLVLADEMDQATKPAQHAFLSKLDATAFPPMTVFVFTANDTKNLEDRFLSRCRVLRFESGDLADDAVKLMDRIWSIEGAGLAKPDTRRMFLDAGGNVRAALNALEVELLTAEPVTAEPVKATAYKWAVDHKGRSYCVTA